MRRLVWLGMMLAALLLLSGGCGKQTSPSALGTLPQVESVKAEESSAATPSEITTDESDTPEPTTPQPTTAEPTTPEPTTEEPTTMAPTNPEPTTAEPTTPEPTTEELTTMAPTTPEPTTAEPTTPQPTTAEPVTEAPAIPEPATEEPTTLAPTTAEPVTEEATSTPEKTYIVCIDPGHQAAANLEQEPVAPDSAETKKKVSDGTRGGVSGIRESVVNLTIALQLRDELERRGYRVVMTRTSEEVDISNIERALIANEAGADAFLRLHCDGSDDPSWNGIAIFCQHPYSSYNGHLYEASRRISEILLGNMVRATGAKNRGVTEAYNYTGINWSLVPGGLIEMGFLTNAQEESRLLDPAYQQLLVKAMADGLDEYFGR